MPARASLRYTTEGSGLLEAQAVQHATLMWIVFHWPAMRTTITFAGILVLLHRFVMLSLFLRALFRSQERVDIPTGFDGGHA